MKSYQLAEAIRPESNEDAEQDEDDDTGRKIGDSWRTVVKKLRAEFGEDLYTSWFARMEIESFSEAKLIVSVPTKFLRNWIESHYAAKLEKICESEFGPLESVVIRVRTRGLPQHGPNFRSRSPIVDESEPTVRRNQTANGTPAARSNDRGSPLDHSLTFETLYASWSVPGPVVTSRNWSP